LRKADRPEGRISSNPAIGETIVALLRDMSFEMRMKQLRSSGRLNSRVAVAVEWADGSRTLRAEGCTVDIALKGCMAVVPQGFAVGQRLRLINLTNQISCEAVLIWRGHEGRAGCELGLELQEPSNDFWGLDF
jgi:hypothetical protein